MTRLRWHYWTDWTVSRPCVNPGDTDLLRWNSIKWPFISRHRAEPCLQDPDLSQQWGQGARSQPYSLSTRGRIRPTDRLWTWVEQGTHTYKHNASHIVDRCLTVWATREVTMEYYPVIKSEIIPFAATLIDPELITLTEMSEKMNTIWCKLYVESKTWHKWTNRNGLTDTENRLAGVKGDGEQWKVWCYQLQIIIYRMDKQQDPIV